MEMDERKWIEESIDLAKRAAERGVTLLLIRKQDRNDAADILVTNATDPKMVTAMTREYADGGDGEE